MAKFHLVSIKKRLPAKMGFYKTRIKPTFSYLIVFRVKDEYQLSWTEEKATAKSGNRNVRLFDEEGFAQFKKAQRNGESTDKIKPLATLQVRYKGSYGSNFLINSEFFVLAISFFAAYVAFQNRMKLVS